MFYVSMLIAGGSGIALALLVAPYFWRRLAALGRVGPSNATRALQRRRAQAAEAQRRAADQVRGKRWEAVRILVINDNAELVTLCQMALEARGHEVETTTDASAVGAAVTRFQPDAIVLDWRLRDRTGGQVLQELQSTFHSPPPVLVMSSLDQVEPEAIRRGARAFLRKPFTDDTLVTAVEALVIGGYAG